MTNTRRIADESPALMLGAMLALGGEKIGAGIEAMESRGQDELVASQVLPTDMAGITDAELTALGFELGPVCEDDPIFRYAILPPGWTKRKTEHAMWSEIVDGAGTVRFLVFYKAAFYDRSAFLRPTPRP